MADVALIRRRIRKATEQARQDAAERRTRIHDAQRAYDEFLEARAIPAFRSVAIVLKSEGQAWEVMTPSGEVRLVPDRRRDESIARCSFWNGGVVCSSCRHGGSRRYRRRMVERETWTVSLGCSVSHSTPAGRG